MKIHLLVATTQEETGNLLQSLIKEALLLVPLELEQTTIKTPEELCCRVKQEQDDLLLLDWSLAGPETPALVRQILETNLKIRVIAILPLQLRQYRQYLWEAGACTSIPLEHLDQEWLSSVLCMVRRSMQREARLSLAHL